MSEREKLFESMAALCDSHSYATVLKALHRVFAEEVADSVETLDGRLCKKYHDFLVAIRVAIGIID